MDDRRSWIVAIIIVVAGIGILALAAFFINRNFNGQEEAPAVAEATATVAPTNEPEPTDTPEPTATPAPTDTPEPTATMEPEEEAMQETEVLTSNLNNSLGPSNRGVDRVGDVSLENGVLDTEWAINDGLTDELLGAGTQLDAATIIDQVGASGLDFETLNLTGTFPLEDLAGNLVETDVFNAAFSQAAVSQIAGGNLAGGDLLGLANAVNINPAFPLPFP